MIKSFYYNHPFHLVTNSPWPLFTSLSMYLFLSGSIITFYNKSMMFMLIGLMSLLMCIFQWWRDVIRESTFQGFHTNKVNKLIQLGMILFIVSELFFFISFFWTFFHLSLSPNIEIGSNWPPLSIYMFNPMNIPLLNTIILLSSGITITWAHHEIINLNYKKSIFSMILTIWLGIYFSILQYMEYNESLFTISDSSYGSIFFLITGFHGMHVIIGTIFILISFFRLKNLQFSSFHHFGFEASAWYWHFVDVIWLFVYILLYWWCW